MTYHDLSTMAKHYLFAALWSSTDEEGVPMDELFSLNDCSEELLQQAQEDCQSFLDQVEALDTDDWSYEQMGHDFLLTRTGAGCGFWSRDWGSEFIRTRLTEIAHSFGEKRLYVGDDGMLYTA